MPLTPALSGMAFRPEHFHQTMCSQKLSSACRSHVTEQRERTGEEAQERWCYRRHLRAETEHLDNYGKYPWFGDIVLSSYPPDIFKSIFTIFISFLSILSLLETRQTSPVALLKASVWETPKVLLGNTPGYCGEHHK